jgi:hypothetical protein
MLTQPLRLPHLYPWYVALASLDVIFTWIIVFRLGGLELNALAEWAITRHGLAGMIALKYASVLLVIVICEHLAIRHQRASAILARFAIALSALPVVAAGLQLALLAGGFIELHAE